MKNQIIISKGGKDYTYNSLSHACNANGATSGMNKVAMLKFLTNAGFDINNIKETETENASGETVTRKTLSNIERLINDCKVIDKKKVDEKTALLIQAVKSVKKLSDVANVEKLQAEIDLLENPIVTIEILHAKVTELYNAFLESEKVRIENERIENEKALQAENERIAKENEIASQVNAIPIETPEKEKTE